MDNGQRVTVNIGQTDTWAHGAAAALNGLSGTIIEVKTEHCAGIATYPIQAQYLVELDAAPAPWSEHQRPSRRWWFSRRDLQ